MSLAVVPQYHHDPFSMRRRTPPRQVVGRYQVEAFLGNGWVELAQKSGDLDKVIAHAHNAYSSRIRIVDNVLGKPLYERAPDSEEFFSHWPMDAAERAVRGLLVNGPES